MAPDTRRLVMLTIEEGDDTDSKIAMLLGKKRASDRRSWLEAYGNMAIWQYGNMAIWQYGNMADVAG